LISQGANLTEPDKMGYTPTHWAKKHNKLQILELLLQNGGMQVTDQARIKPEKSKLFVRKETKPQETKPFINERKESRRYLLTCLREDGHYEPMTDAEFE